MAHECTLTIPDDRTRRLFEVHDGESAAYVWAKGPRDAKETVYVHGYLDDESDGTWEVAEVMPEDRDHAAAAREADHRFDALHHHVPA